MTLTQTAQFYKTVVKIVGITILVLVVLRISWGVYRFIFPSTTEITIDYPFDASYGPLPPLELDKFQIQVEESYAVSLDLITGGFPEHPQIAAVFPVLKAPYGFLSEDRALDLAKTFRMNDEPTKIDATSSVWKKTNEILTIDDQTLNFVYQYNYSADPSVFYAGGFTSQSNVALHAIGGMSTHGIFDVYQNDLDDQNYSIMMLGYDGVQFKPVSLIAQAKAARVDIRRRNIGFAIGEENKSYPFFSPKYVGSVVYVYVAPYNTSNEIKNTNKIVEFNYTHWKYDQGQAAFYPVLTADEAFVALQQAPEVFTVFVGNDDNGPVDLPPLNPEIAGFTIRRIEMGYLDLDAEQDFIQPIWVFIGKVELSSGGLLDWAAYVPAIRQEYIIQPEISE